MKKWLSGLMAAVLTILLTIPAFAIVPAPENTYVGDYADVLSAETEQYIIDRNDKLSRATGGAIVVVTVDFMDGMESADYAYECFNTWGIGDKDRNNGLLLVYAVGENRVWTMAGKGIEDALTGTVLNDWLEDYFYGPYDAGDYERGTLAFFDIAYAWFDSYYGGIDAALSSGNGEYADPVPGGGDEFIHEYYFNPLAEAGKIILLVIVLFAVLVVFDGFRYGHYRRRSVIPGLPPIVYHPIFFGRPHHHIYVDHSHNRRPPSGGFSGFGGAGGGSSFGGFSGGGFGGGSTRGGGAGR